MSVSFALSFIGAIAGAVLAAAAAFLSETGVTGTPGAYLVLVGAIAVLLAIGLSIMPTLSRGLRTAVLVLAVLGAGLTALAAWFLMQYYLMAAMAIALVGVISLIRFDDRRVVR